MEANSLVVTDNEVIRDVLDHSFNAKGYCSFREFYGSIVKSSQDRGCDTFVDEGIYFKALVKLNVLRKGRVVKNNFIEDKEGAYYPANQMILGDVFTNKSIDGYCSDVFMVKRGTIGFNCGAENIMSDVITPLLNLLCDFNADMTKAFSEFTEVKELLKANGKSIRCLDFRNEKLSVLNKHFS